MSDTVEPCLRCQSQGDRPDQTCWFCEWRITTKRQRREWRLRAQTERLSSRYGWSGGYMVAVEADDQAWLDVGQGDYTQAEATEIGRRAFIPGAGGDSGE